MISFIRPLGAVVIVWHTLCHQSDGGGGTVCFPGCNQSDRGYHHRRQRHLAVWWETSLQKLLQPKQRSGAIQGRRYQMCTRYQYTCLFVVCWLCHLESAPPFTVPCEGRESR